MSGTSLDGLDIAYCEFRQENGKWAYRIIHAETLPYPEEIRNIFRKCEEGSSLDLAFANTQFGKICGELARDFTWRHSIQPDFIASHGHTIFHRPDEHMTLQVGSGAAIAAHSGFPVVCDFRTTDVALDGQGAPLVPIGDQLLFGEYAYCLNLGGFSNVSYEKDGIRIAYDICPFNIVLNHFARKAGHEFDDRGIIAAGGKFCQPLFNELNDLEYYNTLPPKSLGKEWLVSEFYPILNRYNLSDADFLNTLAEHFALKIGSNLAGENDKQVLVTGGGALNEYIIGRIRKYSSCSLTIPDLLTISFKEAIVFAFLGLLRWENQINCLASVTGARRDSSGGCIYL